MVLSNHVSYTMYNVNTMAPNNGYLTTTPSQSQPQAYIFTDDATHMTPPPKPVMALMIPQMIRIHKQANKPAPRKLKSILLCRVNRVRPTNTDMVIAKAWITNPSWNYK